MLQKISAVDRQMTARAEPPCGSGEWDSEYGSPFGRAADIDNSSELTHALCAPEILLPLREPAGRGHDG
jgi:hypothetical protein